MDAWRLKRNQQRSNPVGGPIDCAPLDAAVLQQHLMIKCSTISLQHNVRDGLLGMHNVAARLRTDAHTLIGESFVQSTHV